MKIALWERKEVYDSRSCDCFETSFVSCSSLWEGYVRSLMISRSEDSESIELRSFLVLILEPAADFVTFYLVPHVETLIKFSQHYLYSKPSSQFYHSRKLSSPRHV